MRISHWRNMCSIEPDSSFNKYTYCEAHMSIKHTHRLSYYLCRMSVVLHMLLWCGEPIEVGIGEPLWLQCVHGKPDFI